MLSRRKGLLLLIPNKFRFLYLHSTHPMLWCIYSSDGGGRAYPSKLEVVCVTGLPARTARTFVPPFFAPKKLPSFIQTCRTDLKSLQRKRYEKLVQAPFDLECGCLRHQIEIPRT